MLFRSNVVMVGAGKFVEVQGTAERAPFSKQQMDKLLNLAAQGIRELIRVQKKYIGELSRKYTLYSTL